MNWYWLNERLSIEKFENKVGYSIVSEETDFLPLEFSIAKQKGDEYAFKNDNNSYIHYIYPISDEGKRIVVDLKDDLVLRKLFGERLIDYLYVNFVDNDYYKQVKSQFLDIIILSLSDEKAEVLSRLINLNNIDFNLVKEKDNYRLYFKHCNLKAISALIYILLK